MPLRSFAIVYGCLAVMAPALSWAQSRGVAAADRSVFRRNRAHDWLYWLYTPLVTGTWTRAVTFGTLALIAAARGDGRDLGPLFAALRAHSWFGRHALVFQYAEALVVADLVGYWSHRLRHLRGLWPLHAIHHSPRVLDWLAAARMHTLDDLIDNLLVGLAILFLGFDLRVFAAVGPLLLATTLLLHANVPWDFGPLRYVIASPTFHRWHHAARGPSVNKNFAEMFPVIDIIFGTFHWPHGERATEFGVRDLAIPDSLLGQQAYPFRRCLEWVWHWAFARARP